MFFALSIVEEGTFLFLNVENLEIGQQLLSTNQKREIIA